MTERRVHKLYVFALITAVATFVLLLIGGTVNPTGSSLACPDWPLCYGSLMPEMTGGVEFEHTHRLAATTVGLMTFILAIWVFRARAQVDVGTRRLSYLAVGLVIAQGVLGGLTVLLRLPTAISVAHLGISMLFFLLMLWITHRLYGLRQGRSPAAGSRSGLRIWIGLTALVVYLQIMMGALVRHTGAGRICGDALPWCTGGEVWPAFGPAQLHMLHRFVGVAAVVMITVVAFVAWRRASEEGNRLGKITALLAPVMALVQVGLGILTVMTYVRLVPVTAHLGLGAALLADLVLLYVAVGLIGVPHGARAEARSAKVQRGRLPA